MGVGGKLETELGPCAEFCVYHLMDLAPGTEGARQITEKQTGDVDIASPLFSWRMKNIGKGLPASPNGNSQVRQPRVQTNGVGSKTPSIVLKAALPKLILSSSTTLADIAPIIRSKNSGPYDITLDVVFSSSLVYNIIKKSDLLTKATIAKLYRLDESQIIWCGFFDQALAFKATIPRMRDGQFVSSGAYMETDVHASQQYAGLLNLKLGDKICEELRDLELAVLD